jgi:hypothetical protein
MNYKTNVSMTHGINHFTTTIVPEAHRNDMTSALCRQTNQRVDGKIRLPAETRGHSILRWDPSFECVAIASPVVSQKRVSAVCLQVLGSSFGDFFLWGNPNNIGICL